MFWIDLGLLGITAYRMVKALKVAFTLMENLAITILFGLGLKSFIIFFLVQVQVRPSAKIQIAAVLCALFLTLLLTRPNMVLTRKVASSVTEWQTILACLLIGALFLFSLMNAWFFPIIESDAAWYQIKGLSFLNEVRFDSEWPVPQLRQYPPFVPLLFSWLIAFDIQPLRMLFPFFYLALNIIFYCRVREFSGNSKMAAILTLALGTTPFIWWQGVLPFLDLCTAVFYSIGALYWFFWMDSLCVDEKKERSRTMAFLSGLFFGLAAWSRLEFLLYGLIPIVMAICAESYLGKVGKRDRKSFFLFFISLLAFPTLWFLTMVYSDFSLFGRVKMVGVAGVFAWLIVLLFMMRSWQLKLSTLVKIVLLGVVIFIVFIIMYNPGVVSGWKKISIALYRTITVNGFYLFTALLFGFVFIGRFKSVSPINKLFMMFIIFYPLIHLAIFSYSPPKWETLEEFIIATFAHPGNSVNLSDTRGMISIYPILLFYISNIPSVRRGFDDV